MDIDLFQLIARYNELNAGSSAYACPKPTAGSLSRIETHFGIRLPRPLIALARGSRYFGPRFASLGANYESPLHIIRINSHWRRRRRTRRLPRGLVIITTDHDDNYWCLDTSQTASGDDAYPLQFWSPQPLIYPSESSRPTERYADFTSFLRADIYWSRWHSRQREQAQRRRG
ncbi:MAG: SMI1/KNR4 family protein [Rhodanobacteraceae bacterium]|nr:SMI1/KNR4 family protein [Rhodanobacteraceae bacterium]